MKISARNVLRGRVKSVEDGAVNSEVVVEIAPGVEIVSVITKRSREHLGIAPGTEVHAIVKATNVMLGSD